MLYEKMMKHKPTLRAAIVYLTLLTIILTGVTFSRYITKSIGTDTARVASIGDISITETGDFDSNGKLKIIPGTSLEKNAQISFSGSEASTYVFLEMTLSDQWIKSSDAKYVITGSGNTLMSFDIASGWTFLKEETGNNFVYYKELDPNTALEESIISDNTVSVSKYVKESNIGALTDITISFRATAIQSTEFSSADEAWEEVL